MNMKNTVILLILLFSILGLILGVYYTEDLGSIPSQNNNSGNISVNNTTNISVQPQKTIQNDLSKYFT